MAVERARDEGPGLLNGVDAAAVGKTMEALTENPGLAVFRFRLKNRWLGGGHSLSTVTGFYGAGQDIARSAPFELHSDEPAVLAGGDLGANPLEHLLNALAACLTATMVYHAALRGIHIEALESEIEGDIDLRGSLGISSDVRRGFREVRVRFRARTDEKNLARLKALSKLSPVFDVVTKGTEVDVRVEGM